MSARRSGHARSAIQDPGYPTNSPSLKHPSSHTRLDAYLTCPLRYYERLCAIAPIDEVNEDDDPAAVGVLLHNVLRISTLPPWARPYAATRNRAIPSCRSSTKALRALFHGPAPRGWRPPCRRRARPCFRHRAGAFGIPLGAPSRNRRSAFLKRIRCRNPGGAASGGHRHLDRVDWREQEDRRRARRRAVILDYKRAASRCVRHLGRRRLLGCAGSEKAASRFRARPRT